MIFTNNLKFITFNFFNYFFVILGLIINNKLNGNSNIGNKLAKNNKNFSFLKRNVLFQRKLLLYRSLIFSLLLFSSAAWSPSVYSLRRLEMFQKRVLKGSQTLLVLLVQISFPSNILDDSNN